MTALSQSEKYLRGIINSSSKKAVDLVAVGCKSIPFGYLSSDYIYLCFRFACALQDTLFSKRRKYPFEYQR